MIGFIGTSIKTKTSFTQLYQLAINDLSKTGSIPYWTTSVFSSTATDLVLIYEPVTSASAVRWVTLHSWTLNFWIPLRLNYWTPLRMRNDESLATGPTSRRTEYKSPCLAAFVLFFLSVFNCCSGNMLTEPLPSSGHICNKKKVKRWNCPCA
jgi:hypothetical protein